MAPDGTRVGLGSRRLAILDLSPAGHMPMGNEDGRVWITYNGEVYNFQALRHELEARGHRFGSGTDTEVILHLYEEEGPECVHRLNGMFAIAICDLRSGTPTLFLARDHFGIKPLYYAHQGRRLAFASEVKSLLQLPELAAEHDLSALHQYLTFLWVPDPATMFRGIHKLPAGHCALFRDGRLEVKEYWDPEFPPTGAPYPAGEAELAGEIRERFGPAVRSQMVSDVPVGAFLSAGMDSGSIVAMMAGASARPVRTYTISFPRRHLVGESTMDDPAVAARVAEHFGCEHHELLVEPQVAELLPKLIWHMDEPTADPALIMAYLICREARHTVTVLLSGIGGDEVFAGYRKHVAHRWSQAYCRLPRRLREGAIRPLVEGLPSLRGTPLKGPVRLAKKMVRSASLSPQEAFIMNGTYLDAGQKEWLCSPEFAAATAGQDPWARHRAYFDRVSGADFLNQMLYLDLKAFMVSLNLTYTDKMSMACSVETRVPFLDRELFDFVAQHVPPHLKLHGLLRPTTKYLLRRAMRGILPHEVLRQPKAGFGAPVDYWLADGLEEMVGDLLSDTRVRARGYFQPAGVRRMVEEQRSGRRDWSYQIWQLLTLELWLQQFVDHTPSIGNAHATVTAAIRDSTVPARPS